MKLPTKECRNSCIHIPMINRYIPTHYHKHKQKKTKDLTALLVGVSGNLGTIERMTSIVNWKHTEHKCRFRNLPLLPDRYLYSYIRTRGIPQLHQIMFSKCFIVCISMKELILQNDNKHLWINQYWHGWEWTDYAHQCNQIVQKQFFSFFLFEYVSFKEKIITPRIILVQHLKILISCCLIISIKSIH